MAEEGRFYRLSILVDLQDRMHSAMEKVTGTAERFEQRLKNTSRAAQILDRQKIAPVIDGKDKLSDKVKSISGSLRTLTSKAWMVTIRAKDEVSRITNKVSNAMASPMGMLGLGAATVGVGGLVVNGGDKAMDFEAQLSSIKALTGATAEEMERLRALSLKLGADTKYSALEAAQGFEELLKAGLSVSQVENGGAEAALNLATAGGLGLAEAAEIMSTAMNSFKADNMSAAQAANILAGTANASATGVTELKFSLAAVSAVASGVGMSFQDVNAALGLFANNGLKGSDAGTSLKSMLMNMIPDTKKATEEFQRLGLLTEQGTSAFFNQEGRLKSLADISGLLQKSMAGMTDEQRLASMQIMFGSDAIRAANILYKEGADGVKKFTSEMMKVTALDVAKEKMNNAKGAIEQLSGAFETMQIRVMTPFLPLVTRIATGIGDSIDGATDTIVARAEEMAASINGFLDELAGDEKFQAMDWGDKIVYVLDRMIAALDTWSSGPGGEQLGKVLTKLAEIGMRAWMAAMGGMMKGSFNSLLSGNITGAVGLAMGANFLGAGTLIKGGYGLAKGMLGRGAAGTAASGAAETAGAASSGIVNTAKTMGSSLWSRTKDVLNISESAKQVTRIDRAYEQFRTVGMFGDVPAVQAAAKPAGGLLSQASTKGWNLLGGAMRMAQTPIGGMLQKAAVPLGVALDAFQVSQADNKVQAAGGMAGRWTGAWAGGKAGAAGGAAIGTMIAPGVGTAVGGALGGIGGSIAGFFAGGKIGEYVGGLASQLDFTPVKAKIATLKDEMSTVASDIKAKIITSKDEISTAVSSWFSSTKTKIVATKDEMSAAVSSWFDSLPERIGFAVGYSIAWLSELPGKGSAYFGQLVDEADAYVSALPGRLSAWWQQTYADTSVWVSQTVNDAVALFSSLVNESSAYFGQLVNEADAYVSALPGRLAAWWEQTYADASSWSSQTVNDTVAWFSSLPGMAETAWQTLWQTVDTWAANTYNSVINWFSNIPSVISGYFDQAISNISAKADNLWNRVTFGFSVGQLAASGGMPAHATGGIFNTPHIALFAEEGAEAVIPLNPSRRARALDIWTQTGEALGVRQYANGGITGAVALPGIGSFGGMSFPDIPAILGGLVGGLLDALIITQYAEGGMSGAVAAAPYVSIPAPQAKSGDVTVENVNIVNETDEEALALKIGRKILAAAKQKAENSAG